MRTLTLLGSTGSIGTQALDVVTRHPQQFRVHALAAGGSNAQVLAGQILDVRPEVVGVANNHVAAALPDLLRALAKTRGLTSGSWHVPEVLDGPEAAAQIAALPVDVVLNGLSGAVGLRPTVAALQAGNTLALANKESLIIGGRLVISLAQPGQIIPVDSEHSALAQALRGEDRAQVHRLILTASGGPFRGKKRDQLRKVTPAQALAHPTWSMGKLVTINSSTLMNKGLELIEAHLLFDVPFERIDVVVHPQSVVHSLVEFVDGSTLAQASPPDMRIPIALALSWPQRLPQIAPACDWTQAARWEFEPLDEQAFPAVRLARQAGQTGGIAPAIMNAANEECVAEFLAGRLGYLAISEVVDRVLQELAPTGQGAGVQESGVSSRIRQSEAEFVGSGGPVAHPDYPAAEYPKDQPTQPVYQGLSVDDVMAADARARQRAREMVRTQ